MDILEKASGKVVVRDASTNEAKAGLSSSSNVFPHPKSAKLVIITDQPTASVSQGYSLNWQGVDLANCVPPISATTRAEFMDALLTDFFPDASGSGSGGGGTTNTAPEAIAPAITGLLQVGQVLTAVFDYYDDEGDEPDTHLYQWRRADNGSGLNEADIAGATSINYTAVSADSGKYLRCKITPKALTGSLTGTQADTPYYYISNYGNNVYPASAGNLPDAGQVGDPDGLAGNAGFEYDNPSVCVIATSIVSGNGHTYTAQRFGFVSGTGLMAISVRDAGGSNKLQAGVTYLVEFDYRCNRTMFIRGSGGNFTPNQNNVPANIGDALPYSFEATLAANGDLRFSYSSGASGDWIEFSNVRVRPKLA
jgi:hypothetical protein